MNSLNILLTLLGSTDGRDKVLRIVQYASFHGAAEKNNKPLIEIYKHIRTTRKLLRFFRALQEVDSIKQYLANMARVKNIPELAQLLLNLLYHLSAILFYVSDHIVCLSELGLIKKNQKNAYFLNNIKLFFLVNLMGVFKNIFNMTLSTFKNQGRDSEKTEKEKKYIKGCSFDLVKCLFDSLIPIYYWNGSISSKKVGILGVLSSLMGVIQVLGIL